MAFTDPVYKKPVISNTAPKVDARTLGIGNDNVAAAATDRRNQFNEVDLTQVPQASERTLNQRQGDVGMRTHAVENMQASKSIGRGPDLMRPNGSDINGAGTVEVGVSGKIYGDQAFGGVYSKRY